MSKMRAIKIKEAGGPEQLQLCHIDTPKIGDNEVLLEVAAAGVNRPDILQRQGLYQVPSGASPLPGLEVSGKVVKVGTEVRDDWLGKAVVALTHGGGYAEYCAANASHCLSLPENFNFYEGAALPETAFTVYHNVIERGRLTEREVILIHGGSSGIGVMATQVAKAIGATVIITAGSEEKCRFCIDVGADHAINYNSVNFEENVRELYPKGVDVVLDMIGGSYFPQNVKVLGVDGRYLSIAFLQGSKVDLNLSLILLKRLTLTGSTLRPQTIEQKARIADGVESLIWPMISRGKIRSYVDSIFNLEEAKAAHELMESSAHKGKIVLKVR